MGFFSATIRFTAELVSSSKSPASFPNGSRAGRSRFVHVVRIVSASVSGRTGRDDRSTSEIVISVPSSLRPARRSSMGKPECLLLVANRGVAVRVERLEHHRFAVLRIDAYDLIDGEDFGRVRPAHVRHDRVLVLPLIQQNRLGGLIEKIDDRRAPEPKRLIRDAELQHLLALILVVGADQKDDSARSLKPDAQTSSSPVRSRKKNFSGKVKYSCSSR